jgi:hypothetical protein
MSCWLWWILRRNVAGNNLKVRLYPGETSPPNVLPLLKFAKGMGFTAIWISPVVEQVADASRGYHGYSAQNMYALNSNFGTTADLIALATALHERNMVIMDLPELSDAKL